MNCVKWTRLSLGANLVRLESTSSKGFDIKTKVQKVKDDSKTSLKWREAPSEKPNAWYSKLKLFADEEQNSDFITAMQQPIDLSPSAVLKWWKNKNISTERLMQQFIPERHSILGSDLASAHFVLFRGGKVKFLNNPNWIKADENNEHNLPTKYDARYKLEAIRCDNMTLYYEGLENLRRLQNLKFLSFRNVKTFDDWCLDRVCGAENPKLEVLDISGTCITEHGLCAIPRILSLKLLIVDDPKVSKAFELSCSMLSECMPNLKIVGEQDIH